MLFFQPPLNPCKCMKCAETYGPVKVHVVGDDADVRMEDVVLMDHLLQDVPDASGEDQQRDLVLVQMVEKHFVAISEEINRHAAG